MLCRLNTLKKILSGVPSCSHRSATLRLTAIWTPLVRVISLSFLGLILFFSQTSAMEVPNYNFSIKNYDQNINTYLLSDHKDDARPLLKGDFQKLQLQQFYNHYYSEDKNGLSPWNSSLVAAILPNIKQVELNQLQEFDSSNKTFAKQHFAFNFKRHAPAWFSNIKKNMNLASLNSVFIKENKAIAINNSLARALPILEPDFYHLSLPGQGFPFDNLQQSAVWAGTPLYVFHTSKDKAWSLVLTPDAYFAWVKSSDIAYVSSEFIHRWQQAAKKNLIAITKTDTSIVDQQNIFHFTAFIGAVFPLVKQHEENTSILIPVKNEHNQAVIKIGRVKTNAASVMPLSASRKNIANVIKQLQNRPYGWGGAFFYNDCSQELKSLFTPFAIWLPRNSSQQTRFNSTIDLTKYNVDKRLNLLKTKGHPLLTLIYVGGHIMLYVGKKKINHEIAAITYQDTWGLSSQNGDKRYVIGQSLFFPLLKSYPEHKNAVSQANESFFKLVYLDKLDAKIISPQVFVKRFMHMGE